MKIFVCLAIAIASAAAVAPPPSGTCELEESNRQNCGELLSDTDCTAKGCCYDASADNVKKRCFHAIDPCALQPSVCKYGGTCTLIPGIDMNGNTVYDGQFTCTCPDIYPTGSNCRVKQGECITDESSASSRTACGKVKMFADPALACKNRGCCYSNNIEKVKWCFQPESDCQENQVSIK